MKTKRQMTRARRTYTCHTCKRDIRPGDRYVRRTLSFGSPNKETLETSEDGVVVVAHGFRAQARLCSACHSGIENSS